VETGEEDDDDVDVEVDGDGEGVEDEGGVVEDDETGDMLLPERLPIEVLVEEGA